MSKVRKYKVYLSEEERERLSKITKNGHHSAKKITHAKVLLMADEDHPEGRWKDEQISEQLNIHRNTIGRIRKRFVEEGEEPALERKQRETPPHQPKIDGEKEAHLVAICCSEPPEGRTRWTLSLLVDEMKERGIVTEICRETIRKTLKKMNYDLGEKNAIVSPTKT